MTDADKIRKDGNRHALVCQCGACTLPFGYLQNGVIVIRSDHGGKQQHTNVITLADVERMLKEGQAATMAV